MTFVERNKIKTLGFAMSKLFMDGAGCSAWLNSGPALPDSPCGLQPGARTPANYSFQPDLIFVEKKPKHLHN